MRQDKNLCTDRTKAQNIYDGEFYYSLDPSMTGTCILYLCSRTEYFVLLLFFFFFFFWSYSEYVVLSFVKVTVEPFLPVCSYLLTSTINAAIILFSVWRCITCPSRGRLSIPSVIRCNLQRSWVHPGVGRQREVLIGGQDLFENDELYATAFGSR